MQDYIHDSFGDILTGLSPGLRLNNGRRFVLWSSELLVTLIEKM